MAYVPQYDDLNEQIGQFDFKTLAEQVNYNVISGCAATYSSSDLTVTVASGSITHNGSTVAVAGNAITLVPDPLAVNPRWAVIHANGSGTVAVTHGTAAAVPAKPDPGDVTILFAVKVAPGLTIAANATVKLDKRMPKVGGSVEGVDVLSTGVTDGYVLTADGADAAAWEAVAAPTISSTAQEFVEGGAYKGFWGSGPASGGVHTYVTGDLVGLGCQLLESATGAMTADADAGDAVTWLHSTGTTGDSDTGLVGPRLAAANDWTMVWRGTLTTGAAIRNECIGAASSALFAFDFLSVIGFRVITTGEIVGVVDNSGSETTRASGVTPDGATEHTLRIEVREAGTIVRFYLDNAQVGADVTTNIPTGVLYALCGLRNNTASSVTMNTADWFGWREI